MHLILFIVFAGFCLAGAVNLLLQTHPINSALSLIVVMTSLAVLYLLLGAEFLAAAQIIVYAGAIMVLFTFVVMLLNAGREERTLGSRSARAVGFPAVVVILGVLATVILRAQGLGTASLSDGSPHPHRDSGGGCLGASWRRRPRPESGKVGRQVNSLLSQEVPLSWYLLLSAVLFSLGVLGFLIKRNLITVFMSIELMLNAVNLSFVTFAHQWHAVKGQIFVFFVMMVAAAEAAVGLAIIIAIFRVRATLAVDRIDLMKL
jgi:NADH:ubiquinone oxidoreductase subunit K/NADH:ubiquinone oxidoreductase subunit 6 (subunit J)